MDALSSLERDVMKRTQQAQQVRCSSLLLRSYAEA